MKGIDYNQIMYSKEKKGVSAMTYRFTYLSEFWFNILSVEGHFF